MNCAHISCIEDHSVEALKLFERQATLVKDFQHRAQSGSGPSAQEPLQFLGRSSAPNLQHLGRGRRKGVDNLEEWREDNDSKQGRNVVERKEIKAEFATRSPKRVTATIPWYVLEKLLEKSSKEGRSLSNLISYLLEKSVGE